MPRVKKAETKETTEKKIVKKSRKTPKTVESSVEIKNTGQEIKTKESKEAHLRQGFGGQAKERRAVIKVNLETLKSDILDSEGKRTGSITLPKTIFGAKINPKLMAQAIRVYLVNQRQGTVSTKTRGEVDGSTRKIYRQKGTGRARHGGIRAPIFVKGGIAHGPRTKNYELRMSKNMKRSALFSALSAKVRDQQIAIVDGLESLERKTKLFAKAFENWKLAGKGRSALLILPKDTEHIYRAARNLAGVTITTAQRLNTYEVLQHKTLVFMKEAIESLEKTYAKRNS